MKIPIIFFTLELKKTAKRLAKNSFDYENLECILKHKELKIMSMEERIDLTQIYSI